MLSSNYIKHPWVNSFIAIDHGLVDDWLLKTVANELNLLEALLFCPSGLLKVVDSRNHSFSSQILLSHAPNSISLFLHVVAHKNGIETCWWFVLARTNLLIEDFAATNCAYGIGGEKRFIHRVVHTVDAWRVDRAWSYILFKRGLRAIANLNVFVVHGMPKGW